MQNLQLRGAAGLVRWAVLGGMVGCVALGTGGRPWTPPPPLPVA